MTEPHKIWIEQCEAVEGIDDDFGPQNAIGYLVGEKFLNFLEAAETDPDFRAEVPAFVARIKTIFEPWQLAAYLKNAKETEDKRKGDIRQCTRGLLLVERAKEWLLEGDETRAPVR